MSEILPQKMPAIKDWLKEATDILSAAGIESARLDSELILSHTVGKGRTYLHAHSDEELTDRQLDIASARLELRRDHVPTAYIIGHKQFFGRSFSVTTATLIPRPESEDMILLLKKIAGSNLSLLKDSKTKRLVDVGTGSGILGITAKLEIPDIDVTLIDNSKHALQVAEKNATSLGAQVRIIQSNLLDSYPLKADYILANLPYVDKSWKRSPETNHEPPGALFAGQEGLSIIFRFINQAQFSLNKNGILILEADPSQHSKIIKKANSNGLEHIETFGYQLGFRLNRAI